MRTLVFLTLVAAAAGFAPALAQNSQPWPAAPGWVTAGFVPPGQSLVVVHNCSGKTTLSGTYVVYFDGGKVARLGRCQYTAVLLAPGAHEGWTGKAARQAFTTTAGRVTHWAVANAPGKSWIAPFGDAPFAFGVVPDSLGRMMMREHRWVEPLVPLPAIDVPDSTKAAML
jgi:hypothetical protein